MSFQIADSIRPPERHWAAHQVDTPSGDSDAACTGEAAYSARSVSMGSIFAARRAGTYVASAAPARITPTAAIYAVGSKGSIRNNSEDIKRANAAATTRPMATPAPLS